MEVRIERGSQSAFTMIQKETLRRLEFDKILETVAQFAHCEASRQRALDIVPLPSPELMERRFGLVEELRTLTRLNISLKLSRFEDITRQIRAVRPRGAVLAPLDLQLFIPTLRVMAAIASQLRFRTDVPLLQSE